jgi:FtsP/CotA-like multicopper oxidase with cupredoxin domain
LAVVLAAGTVLWQHWASFGAQGSLTAHAPYLLVDLMLAVPVAGLAVWLVAACGRRLGLGSGAGASTSIWEPAVRAGALAIVMTVLYVPLAAAQGVAHAILGTQGAGHAHHGATGLPATDVAGFLGYGVNQALPLAMAILLLALVGVVLTDLVRRDVWRGRLAPKVRPLSTMAWVLMLVVSTLAGTLSSSPAAAAIPGVTATGTDDVGTQSGSTGCAGATQRVFNVSAINVDIVVNRVGDHDPYGYMYVLASREAAVRAQEAALLAASSMDINDPAAAKVSIGLGQDAIQPLVLRARLGECVVINLTNKLTQAPRGGPNGNPVLTQPGGVPPVSIDLAGVAYDAAGGQGGQAVGANPNSVMAAPGATRQYKYFLDPTMGEGAKVFRSGGASAQLTAHGLFGALIAEPAGATWFDPVSGAEKTSDNTWSNWEAMVKPSSGPAFREFTIIYHEIGDENFNLRRPLRENADAAPVGDQVQFGRNLPMIDTGAPNAANPRAGGGGTDVYRPGSRALNYRAESFFRRLQLEAARGRPAQQANESIAYSSYPYGDPATPIPRSYLGEPTKTRLVHAGFEQLHVHHLHGGATRWRQNPGADNTAIDSGLSKVPIQNAKSVRLDSQTISPMEAFNLEHECGAGGCQQAAGDFLYHCHIAHHYIAGMWGLWRVFDTAQATLARLPNRAAAPTAVNSAGLLGRVIEGKTVVLQANLTNPSTQVALEALVEGQLPPQGARWTTGTGPDPDDATVWDWLKGGTATAPVYLGEPETTAVWFNYRSATPGVRPEILFNPVNGRPAYPMLRPHLGMRPPFSPNGHSGAPNLGDTATATRPDGLCPAAAPVRQYDITAITVPIQNTARERDEEGEIYVLNEDKNAVLGGTKPADPLVIRSNVGDCVAITFGQELDPVVMPKTNMHTHFVQFDPRASDGVITGFSFEQSVFSAAREARTLTAVNAANKITVSNVNQLRVGISIGIGVGRANIEIRKITAISGNQLTFDSNLVKSHSAGEPVTVEFVQYRWYSDVDSGTVFWHDHVDGIDSWAHGLFGAHIIEPKNSTYRDPVTGAAVKSGTIVDIINTSGGSVGIGQSGSFREYMIFLHNGRRGRSELTAASGGGLNPFSFGQECEEGSINLRAAPVGERTPPGANPADPATTMQRQEYNGVRCRNAFSRGPDDPNNAEATTVRATVSTVDPYVFSSVKYGDPMTPLLRAYVGDPVVIRTIGLNERAEALRFQGHRFRMERFNANAQLMDAATTGISERFDYVLDGGAGGPYASPGDYLYYSTRTFAFESGAWGIFRVHDKLQGNLKPLPDRTAPASGTGFPRQVAATGNTQVTPGPNPAAAYNSNGTVNTNVVTNTGNPCPSSARQMAYDVSLFNKALPTAPFSDVSGVIYSLTSDMAGILAGTKPVEPLVLRANKGDCVKITLRNQTTAGSLYGGTRAGLDLGKLNRNQQLSAGAAIGLNADTTVAAGQSITYTYYADQELGTTLFQNLGSLGSLRHGATGMLIVEPANATWADSFTNAPLGPTKTAVQAAIRIPNGPKFREFALMVQTTDQQ